MPLRTVAWLFLFVMPFLQGAELHDEYSVHVVGNAFNQYKDGIHLDYIDRQINRLGDRVSISLLKLLDENQLTNPETIRALLPVVLEAFKYPQLISIPEDREPKVTNYLLRHLEIEVRDPALKREILGAIKTIQGLTSKPVSKPSGTP